MTQFALNEDQIAIRDMARGFAAEKIALAFGSEEGCGIHDPDDELNLGGLLWT